MNLARVAGGPTPSDPPNPPPAHHLPARKVIAFGLGHVLNDLCASCWFSYLLVLMHHVLGLASWQSATILLSGQIADAVATPLVGIYSDKAKGWQCGAFYIGRRHLWYIFGTALVIVNFFMLFARCVLCDILGTDEAESRETSIVIYYSIAAALFNVGWASVQVSHLSMVPELTADETTRVVLNSVRYSATVGSNLFVFALLAVLINAFSLGQATQFLMLALTSLGVGTVTSVIFLIGTEETRPKEEQLEWKAAQQEKRRAVAAADNANEGDYTLMADESPSKRDVQSSSMSLQQPRQQQPATSGPPPKPQPIVASIRIEPQPSSPAVAGTASNIRTPSGSPGSTPTSARVSGPARGQTVLDAGEHSTSDEKSFSHAFPTSSSFSASSSEPESRLAARLSRLPVQFVSWRCWFRQSEYYVAWVIYVCTRVVVNVSQVCLPFYVLDVLHFPDLYITVLPCTVYLSSLLASVGMKRAHLRFGRKATFVCGFLCVIGGCLGMLFLPSNGGTSDWVSFLVFPCAIAIGLGNGIAMVACGALVAELIGSRTNHAAFVFGSFSFGDKLATGVLLFVVQTLNPDTAEYWRLAATVPTIGAAVLACVMIVWKVDLREWRRKHTAPKSRRNSISRPSRNDADDDEEQSFSQLYASSIEEEDAAISMQLQQHQQQ